MKPTKMEQHRLEEIRGALRERPRTTVAQWGNATVYDLMAHIAALEAEVAQARERALEEAAVACETAAVPLNLNEWQGTRHNFARATADSLAAHIRALKSKPVQEATTPIEMASEDNGLLPKKRQPRMPPCGHARCEVLGSGEEAHAATCPNFGTR